MATKKNEITNTQIAVGAGIGAALIAAAAGTYFLYGKDAPKRRKAVGSWMLKAKAEVLEQIEKLPTLDKETYYGLIDAAADKYAGMKDMNSAEIADLAKEMKGYWSGIKKQFMPAKKSAKKGGAKQLAKKSSKKTAKKSAK